MSICFQAFTSPSNEKVVSAIIRSNTDAPNQVANQWVCIQWVNRNNNYGVQISFSFMDDAMYIRRLSGGTKTSWKQI